MGETQTTTKPPVVSNPAETTPEVTQPVKRDIPPPIAPVNGPVPQEPVLNIPVNVNIDPKNGNEVRPNGLMPEAEATKKILDTQPKVSIWLPLTGGEKKGQAVEFVSINGYPYWIKKGTLVQVPQSVAELLINMYNIEVGDSSFGQSMRVDRQKTIDGQTIQNALNA